MYSLTSLQLVALRCSAVIYFIVMLHTSH